MEKMKIVDTNLEDEKKISNLPYFSNKSHLTLIIGTVCSGKSRLCYEMVNGGIYAGKYDLIYLMALLHNGLPEYPYKIPQSQMNGFDLEWFHSKMNNLKKANEDKIDKKEEPYVYNVLLIIDDFASYLKKMKQSEIVNLFLKRRHFHDVLLKGKVRHLINLSIIVTSQYYRLIPQEIRNQTTSLIFFSVPQIELVKIKDELVKENVNKKRFLEIMASVFSIPYSSVQIRNDTVGELKYTVIRQNDKGTEYVVTPLAIK